VFFEKKKNCKNRLSVEGPPPRPRVGTPPHFYNLLSISFLALNALHYPNKEQNNTTENVMLLLLLTFCTYFFLQILLFLLMGAQEYFLRRAQSTLATPLVAITT